MRLEGKNQQMPSDISTLKELKEKKLKNERRKAKLKKIS